LVRYTVDVLDPRLRAIVSSLDLDLASAARRI